MKGPYNEYKESGVQWLGKIPAHWKVRRIKDLSELQSGSSITSHQFTDEGYPVYGGNGLRGFFSQYNHQGEYILIGRQGALCGNINYATGKFWASEHAVVVYKSKEVDTFWYGELLRTMDLNQYSLAAAQPGLSVDKIKRLELPAAPAAEQVAIAQYLTAETAAIDRKVSLLEQKIKLYQTLRKTLINETVCRGLHPNAPRRDSGIEWIGEIPANWEVKRLKDVTKVVNGSTPSSGIAHYWDGDIVWVTPADFGSAMYVHDSAKKITPSGFANCGTTMVPKGTVILSARAPIGSLAIAGKPVCTNQGCKAIIPLRIDNKYLYYFLTNQTALLNSIGNGTIFKELSTSSLNSLMLPVPPQAEQLEITAYLDKKTSQANQVITNLTTQITTLKELRKTLINDVVTGKLNVTE